MGSYYLIFDIETAPSERIDEYLNTAVIKPNANLKDPEKIIKNREEKRQKIKAKAPLYWWIGRVVCISAYSTKYSRLITWYDVDETKLLFRFGRDITKEYGDHQLQAKNIEFDRPFLIGRYIASDIGVPANIRLQSSDKSVDDIDKYLSLRSSQCQQITTLDNYAFGLGITGKHLDSGIDIRDLYYKWRLGDQRAIGTIQAHCERDVEITAEFHRRATKEFDPDDESVIETKMAVPF